MESKKLHEQPGTNLPKFPEWEQPKVNPNKLNIKRKKAKNNYKEDEKSITEKDINITYLNVQGLNHNKFIELSNLINKNKFIFITETHMNYDNLKPNDDIICINKMRKENDKKGGGISMLYKKDCNMVISEIEVNNPDILCVKIATKITQMIIITVYVSVLNKQEDKIRNMKIQKEMEKLLMDFNEDKILIIGDFNGHIKEIGKQKENYNGKVMKNLVDRHSLEILNLSEKCEGKITWKRASQSSTIDFALANEKALTDFKRMKTTKFLTHQITT